MYMYKCIYVCISAAVYYNNNTKYKIITKRFPLHIDTYTLYLPTKKISKNNACICTYLCVHC